MLSCLEFLSEDEVEMAASVGLAAKHLVEAVSPVNTKQTDHGQEDTSADTYRTLHIQRIELLDAAPSITALSKYQAVEVRARTQDEGVAKFHRETVVGITRLASWCERTIVVTAHSDGLGSIGCAVSAGSVATHIEGLERRAFVLVVMS